MTLDYSISSTGTLKRIQNGAFLPIECVLYHLLLLLLSGVHAPWSNNLVINASSAPKSYLLSDLLQFILKIVIELSSLSCDVNGKSYHSQFCHVSQRPLKSKQNI